MKDFLTSSLSSSSSLMMMEVVQSFLCCMTDPCKIGAYNQAMQIHIHLHPIIGILRSNVVLFSFMNPLKPNRLTNLI